MREVLLVIVMTADSAASADTTATPTATAVDTVTPAAVPCTAVIGAITAVITSVAILTATAAAQLGNHQQIYPHGDMFIQFTGCIFTSYHRYKYNVCIIYRISWANLINVVIDLNR